MSQLAADSFNRANGGLGANWSAVTAPYYSPLQIVSGMVEPNGTIEIGQSCYTAIPWPCDQSSSVTVLAVASGAGAGPTVRAQGGSSPYCYGMLITGPLGAGATITLTVYSAATGFASLGSTTATVNAGSVVSLTVTGTTLLGLINGILVISAVNAAIGAGSPGIAALPVNYQADVQFDNWAGGNMIVAPIPDSPTVIVRVQDYLY